MSPGSIRHVWQNRQKIKWPYLRLHTTHALDFGTVKDNDNIYYSTKNQVRGLYVGGDMAILFFGDFARHGE